MPQPLVIFAAALFTAASLAAADNRPGQTFKTGDVTIYYEVLGNGPGTPLFVANGGPGFDHTYLHLSDAFDQIATSRKVVLYDQRGNGRSSPVGPGQSCTLRDQIEDLDALRAHLN